ncbi:MAG: VanZ family protein [Blastochloris sp.]|nr:VanZ family protein [Blastochloris sp.]
MPVGSWRKIKLGLPALGWAALILLLSSIPGKELPHGPELPHLDKLVHVGLYAVLAFLLGRTGLRSAWVILLSIAFGCLDEFYQSLTPGRSPDGMDILADACGALLGAGFHVWLKGRGKEESAS